MSSPESNSVGTVGTTVPVQATPGSPIPQGHPGDVTVVVTDLVESASVGGTDAEQSVPVELTAATGGTGAEQSVLVEPRAVAADGTDDVRPSLVEPATPDGTGAERSVLVESREVTDGTGVELSMLVESDGTGVERSALVESCAVVGGTDDDPSPGGHGGGGGRSLGTPGSVVRPHELEQAELVARGVITDYVKPALLVGGAGARVGGSAAEPPGGASCASQGGSSKASKASRSDAELKRKRLRRREKGARGHACRGDDDESCRSVISELSEQSFPYSSAETPVSQRSKGSLARQ